MKTKRTVEEKLAGTKEAVTINGKVYSPKRLKVFDVQRLMNEKAEKLKAVQAMQRRLMKIQAAMESGELESLNLSTDEAEKYVETVQNTTVDLATELGTDHNLWLLERLYPDAKESGDLVEIEYDEYDTALEAIFEVNPSLGKSKAILLMNPLNQNG
ncbi:MULTISPECIES: hypothetical protein [Deinococcus]|uniref:Uncharacterized protein n=1 Tax=Deinococcus rufus TaxID=2136097 RepID=A0ABV7Z9W3_9DEIO|nr:hypothetical protein [Deinococcus sp. AB2017081]WQE94431.1 hypothetical protein U2P90_13580 [Deinococcus sp. AB2017081]